MLAGRERDEATALGANGGITSDVLLAALVIKAMAGQIDVVHAFGILVSLPYLLEDGEVIEQVSLGAGATGKPRDSTIWIVSWLMPNSPARERRLRVPARAGIAAS